MWGICHGHDDAVQLQHMSDINFTFNVNAIELGGQHRLRLEVAVPSVADNPSFDMLPPPCRRGSVEYPRIGS